MFSTETSGDYYADRRFIMAMQLHERGDSCAALDLLLQAQELAPEWPPLPFRRGEIFMELNRREEALEAFKHYLQLDPIDRLGAAIKLTLLGATPQPETLPAPYVESLFDDYAPRFDSALLETLSYRVPQLLANIVENYRPYDTKTAECILDLGCGTGLAGETFAKRAGWLEGIDLSAGMIEQAAAKKLYNKLLQGDIMSALHNEYSARPYQLVLAADVLVYIGEIKTLFGAIKQRLAPAGLFAFSTQKLTGGDMRPFALGPDHRYAHSEAYIRDCLAEADLRLIALEEHIIRKDAGLELTGYIVLAEAPPAPTAPILSNHQPVRKPRKNH